MDVSMFSPLSTAAAFDDIRDAIVNIDTELQSPGIPSTTLARLTQEVRNIFTALQRIVTRLNATPPQVFSRGQADAWPVFTQEAIAAVARAQVYLSTSGRGPPANFSSLDLTLPASADPGSSSADGNAQSQSNAGSHPGQHGAGASNVGPGGSSSSVNPPPPPVQQPPPPPVQQPPPPPVQQPPPPVQQPPPPAPPPAPMQQQVLASASSAPSSEPDVVRRLKLQERILKGYLDRMSSETAVAACARAALPRLVKARADLLEYLDGSPSISGEDETEFYCLADSSCVTEATIKSLLETPLSPTPSGSSNPGRATHYVVTSAPATERTDEVQGSSRDPITPHGELNAYATPFAPATPTYYTAVTSQSGLTSYQPSRQPPQNFHTDQLLQALMNKEVDGKLPSFDGKCEEFPVWKSAVEQLVSCPIRQPATKFALIKAALKGDAAQATRHLVASPTQACVDKLMEVLRKEYGQMSVVINAQFAALDRLPTLQPTVYSQFRDWFGQLSSIINTLETYDSSMKPKEEATFYHRIQAKVPQYYAQRWISSLKGRPANVGTLLDYLEQQLDMLRAVAGFASGPARSTKQQALIVQDDEEECSYTAASEPAGKKEAAKDAAKKKPTGGNNDKTPRYFKCPLCKMDSHLLENCRKFATLTPAERLNQAKGFRIHYRCLRSHGRDRICHLGADEQKCPTDPNCPHKHHALLHVGRPAAGAAQQPGVGLTAVYAATTGAHHLEMLRIRIRGPSGTKVTTAVIDTGASRTIIDEGLAKALGIPVNATMVSLRGIHGAKEVHMGDATFEIAGIADDADWFKVQHAGTLERLRIPGPQVNWADWAKRQPKFNKLPLENLAYNDVRILLGIDLKALIKPVSNADVASPDQKYIAYRNKLGWAITGPRADKENPIFCCFQTEIMPNADQQMINEFRHFNELEAIGIVKKPSEMSRQEDRDLVTMTNSVTRRKDGRMQLPMLFKGQFAMTPSETQARRRLTVLLKRFEREPVLGAIYAEGIRKDLGKDYIRRLTPIQASTLRNERHWFLPHFPVFHPDKPEKCRRVLDAAAQNSGVSLNSRLSTGPNLLNSLIGVILRFRCGKVALNADITEMFSQVVVDPSDENMLAFLWAEKLGDEPDVYVNTRHVFGAKCSPSIANFAVRQAAAAGGATAQQVVKRSFYMDDLYWSNDDVVHVIQVAQDVAAALGSAGFQLGKWMSNSTEVLATWPEKDCAVSLKEFAAEDDPTETKVKALGLAWDYTSDTLTFSTRQANHEVGSPAEVLSMLASVFDPTGIVAPFTLQGKLRMQEIWDNTQDWRKALTPQQKDSWKTWSSGIPAVAQLSIKRPYGLDASKPADLHVFADASTVGYGAVAYLLQGTTIAFVASKNRIVSKKKATTIPRLELQALIVAIRLADMVHQELRDNYNVARILLWSDSIIVLFWTRNQETRYHVFVANRLHEVHEFLQLCEGRDQPVTLRHVPTADNPADLVSRGQNAEEFTASFGFWTNGPSFLMDEARWPENQAFTPTEEPEVKTTTIANLAWDDGAAADTFDTMKDYVLSRLPAKTTVAEMRREEIKLLLNVQADSFPDELRACNASDGKSSILAKGVLQRRHIFLDDEGILRIATRLANAEFVDDDAKFPIALPRRHALTSLIIRSAHQAAGHQGVGHTKAEILRRFHVSGLTNEIKKEIYLCKICRMQRPIQPSIPTAPLHRNRLQFNGPPFTDCGMDHFGPIVIARRQKRWGLIFMCLTTRAVHLEATTSTDLPTLLLAMSRFVSRRGKPKRIRSDQGTSFVKAAKEQEKSVEAHAAAIENGIARRFAVDFLYNPAGAPHWGGSWERMIKEVKKVLTSSVESVANLSHEAFVTSLAEVEAILNRRPLTFDENGLPLRPCDILTPGILDAGQFPTGISTMEQVRQVRQARQHFWQRWQACYLPSLAVTKIVGKVQPGHLLPGDHVLLREGSNALVDTWNPAKILETYPSADGCVRSVLVETANGSRKVQDVRRISIAEGPALLRRKTPEAPTFSRGVSAPDDSATASP